MSVAVYQYSERDILCGRGGKVNRHSGNRVYRRLIEYKKDLYKSLPRKEDKAVLISSIIHALKSEGARFLCQDDLTNSWYEIDDTDAIKKTSQAFREPDRKCPSAAAVAKQLSHQAYATVSPSIGDCESCKTMPLSENSMHSVSYQPVSYDDRQPTPQSHPQSTHLCGSRCQRSLGRRSSQDTQDISNFMQSIATGESASAKLPPSQQSQDLQNLLKCISVGDRPVTESAQHCQEFMRYMRAPSIASMDPTDVLPTEQDRNEFVRMMRSISSSDEQEQQQPQVMRLVKSISGSADTPEPALTSFFRQDSLDLFQHFMRAIPPENSTTAADVDCYNTTSV